MRSPWSRFVLAVAVAAIWAAGTPVGLRAQSDAPPPPQVAPDHPARMKEGLALFRERVRPVLVASCLRCHGGEKVMGDLDLSTRETLLASGHAVAGASALVGSIAHTRKPHMPAKGGRLDAETVARVARWIDLGAPYDGPLVERAAAADSAPAAPPASAFWSFRPLADDVPVPVVAGDAWSLTPIDRFVRAAQEREGLTPNPAAPRRALLRRAAFDLIGLPPAAEEIEAFESSGDPRAWENAIDALLASPHYGERQARHWMDVARFAESHGYEQDYDRPHAYHYRDFLIRAFNDDMPFDRFARWQLAGDELAPDDPWAMVATGFLGAGAFPTQLTEAEFESARYDELDDMVGTTGAAFLGLTVGCARCHDHKFDPIRARDYYAMVATFATTIRSEIDLVLEPGAAPVKAQVTSEGYKPTKHHADERGFPHFYETTYFLERGDVHNKKEAMAPGVLTAFSGADVDVARWRPEAPEGGARTSLRRAALARWLTDVDGGAGRLVARVIVNRIWQQHFGEGLVSTPSDFGEQGARPTHPELLEWLAADLVRSGWRLKRLHKLILMSAVYRQSSDADEGRLAIDRDNRWLWRWPTRRLDAEAIRDAMLAVSGKLDRTLYGPGTLDESMARRSIYFFIKRSKLIPTMMLFDWPEHLVSIGKRSTTTVAPQALLFLNSPQGRALSGALADRLDGADPAAVVAQGVRAVLGRAPAPREAEASIAFLREQERVHGGAGAADAAGAARRARTDFCQALLAMNEFIYLD